LSPGKDENFSARETTKTNRYPLMCLLQYYTALCNTQILRITNCSSAGLFSLLVLVRPSDPSDRLRAPKLGVFRQPCLMNDAVRVQTGGAEIGRCHWSCWSISEQTKAPFTPSAYIVACKCGHTNTHGFMHMQIAKLRAGGHVSS